MREDLALKHLLLTEARTLLKNINQTAHIEIKNSLLDLINSLEVTYDHHQQIFSIKTTIKEKVLSQHSYKSEFQFYKRADKQTLAQFDEKPTIGSDTIADNNAKQAQKLIISFISQSGLDITIFDSLEKKTPFTFIKFQHPLNHGDWIIVLLFSLLSALFTFYQGTETFNFLDNSYTLETTWRILNGEIPYKDFTLVLTPGTFLVQAFLMKIFGDNALIGLYWCAFAMAATILLTYKILSSILTPKWLGVLLCLIPIFGGNAVIPYVWYDVDVILFCLCSIAMLLEAEKRGMPTKWMFPTGFLAVLPLTFKQNIGLAHLAIILTIVNLSWFLTPWKYSFKKCLLFHIGVISALAMLLIPFWYFGALQAFFNNTIVLPATLRTKYSMLGIFFSYFPYSIPQKEPILSLTISFLLWGTLIFEMFFWFSGTHKNITKLFLPLWIWGLSLAGLISQKHESLSPLYRLLAIFFGLISVFISHFPSVSKFVYRLIYMLAIALTIYFMQYALSGRRLAFCREAFVSPTPFQSIKMQGLYSSPQMVKGFDEIVNFVLMLPKEDTFILLPTEDPLYFATNRKSPIRFVQSFTDTGATIQDYLIEVRHAQPDWIFQKVNLQFRAWSYFLKNTPEEENNWFISNYKNHITLNNYVIWKKINAKPQ